MTTSVTKEGRIRADGFDAGFGLVEALAALALISIAVLGVAGTSLGVSGQDRDSSAATDRTLAAQQVMERLRAGGYAAASSGVDAVAPGGRTLTVSRTVTPHGPRLKAVRLDVVDSGAVGPAFASRLLARRPLPAAR